MSKCVFNTERNYLDTIWQQFFMPDKIKNSLWRVASDTYAQGSLPCGSTSDLVCNRGFVSDCSYSSFMEVANLLLRAQGSCDK